VDDQVESLSAKIRGHWSTHPPQSDKTDRFCFHVHGIPEVLDPLGLFASSSYQKIALGSYDL
jgi:hypothetical protein